MGTGDEGNGSKDPLQFANEEEVVSPHTQKATTLGSDIYGNSIATTEPFLPTSSGPTPNEASTTPVIDSEDASTPSTDLKSSPYFPDALYPHVAAVTEPDNGAQSRYYGRQESVFVQEKDLDLEDYPAGPAHALAESHVRIAISDPVKMTGPSLLPGVNEPYMTYLITTDCSLPSYLPAQTTVRRRFKDVVALSNLLRNTHRGYFVPPRPEKNAVKGKTMDTKFIEYRRRALERYLNVLGVHPVIGKSEEFKSFLSLDSDLRSNPQWVQLYPSEASWVDGVTKLMRQMVGQQKAIPDPTEAAKSTRKTHDVVRMVKEGLQLHRNRQQGGEQYEGDELQLRSDRALVEDSRKSINDVVRKSEAFSRRFKRYVNIYSGLADNMSGMGKYEDEQSMIAGDGIRMIAECCSDVYQTGSLTQEKSQQLLTLFYHYKHLMPAVLEGMNAREGALLTLETLDNEVNSKKAKVEELNAPSSIPFDTRQKRIANLQSDLTALQAARESADQQYQLIRKRNQQDMEFLYVQKDTEFMDMLTNLAEIQFQWWSKQQQMWTRAAMDLGASKIDLENKQ
eukprot:TRINITY_DN5273_c0_g1_i1.p1 TRINITY_DN5273_c0_g1~~TRINITY_DN5273_c0_g1_i1.p1  ORF type:complete len:585 (-),score=103.75 TRINITY_DN5273_c0_g1_i1:1211-2908(-)